MRSIMRLGLVGVVVAVLATALRAGAAGPSCTGGGAACEPRCRASWEEKKTKPDEYEIRCEYACARARDPWHAPEPECRCQPPCGAVYVKKRLYKSEGKETSERVPKYDIDLVSRRSCGCAGCVGGRTHGWNPLGILTFLHLR